ncbi:MAG: glycosyltransferase family 9 protein [bacterium]
MRRDPDVPEGRGGTDDESEGEGVSGRKRILVVELDSPGAVLFSMPALKALRDRFPDSHITIVTRREAVSVVVQVPYVDRIIIFNEREFLSGSTSGLSRLGETLGKTFMLLDVLRRERYDLAIDLGNSPLSAFLVALSGAGEKVGNMVGRPGWLNRFFTSNATVSDGSHLFEAKSAVVEAIGCKKADSLSQEAIADLAATSSKFIGDFLALYGVNSGDLLLGVNPSANRPSEQWMVDCCANFCDELCKRYGAKVVLFGRIQDTVYVNKMLSIMKTKPIVGVGRLNLRQFAALISRCAVIVTTDVYSAFIASSLGVRSISLFGPSKAAGWIPAGGKNIIIRKSVRCSPCTKYRCNKMECMKSITVDDVMQMVDFQLRDLSISGSTVVGMGRVAASSWS